tara:strand:+ start:3417 stop:4370 length:954 start_codon:yes stop_codon:yes gene_type:complete
MSVLSKPYFHDEEAAYAKLESLLWVDGPICPHCGGVESIYKIKANKEKRVRIGLHKCGQCRKQFTVKVGTVFESSNVKLHLWFQAAYLMASSKKGISAHQLHRTLGVTYKTAWFMAHRLREAMRSDNNGPLGGEGMVVEADETYFGYKKIRSTTRSDGKPYKKGQRGPANKRAIVSLVERGGNVRSFHVDSANKVTVTAIVAQNVAKESRLHTDESRLYSNAHMYVAKHESVKHTAGEYVRGDVTSNSIEGYFSVFKRGMKGTYQHCSEKHLHRYLAEFDFRFNKRTALGVNDDQRADHALRGIVGKRLTYGGSASA